MEAARLAVAGVLLALLSLAAAQTQQQQQQQQQRSPVQQQQKSASQQQGPDLSLIPGAAKVSLEDALRACLHRRRASHRSLAHARASHYRAPLFAMISSQRRRPKSGGSIRRRSLAPICCP
jgi:hypothetical protein